MTNLAEAYAERKIIAKAVNEYQSDDVQIDYWAEVNKVDGGAWVQAWVWVEDEKATPAAQGRK